MDVAVSDALGCHMRRGTPALFVTRVENLSNITSPLNVEQHGDLKSP